MNLTLDTWIISDTHFYHDNIVKYCNRPHDHNTLMVANWFDTVGPEENILHLGDVFMGGREAREKGIELCKMLPGRRYLILGNHDKENEVVDAGFEVVECPQFFQHFNDTVKLSHYPLNPDDIWDINIHGHTHNRPASNSYAGYVNVSVEMTNYRPRRLGEILWEATH